MKLTKHQYYSCKKILENIAQVHVHFFNNGIFEILDVNESDKESIYSKLNQLEFIENLSAAFYRLDNDEKLYRIFGSVNINQITEEVKINNTLNPKLWDNENELIPEVKEKIKEIVKYFKEQLKEDGIDLEIDDIYLLGSNANFNYKEDSDLDIHIIADESFDCDSEHLDIIYNAYRNLFNKKYDIKINGIDVELYVEDKDAVGSVTAGLYSMNDGWIKLPTKYEIPEIDEAALDKSVAKWESRYLELTEAEDLDAILQYIDDIYKLRGDSLKTDGEFGIGNLTFKEIRRLGYLDALKELRDKLQSKELSL